MHQNGPRRPGGSGVVCASFLARVCSATPSVVAHNISWRLGPLCENLPQWSSSMCFHTGARGARRCSCQRCYHGWWGGQQFAPPIAARTRSRTPQRALAVVEQCTPLSVRSAHLELQVSIYLLQLSSTLALHGEVLIETCDYFGCHVLFIWGVYLACFVETECLNASAKGQKREVRMQVLCLQRSNQGTWSSWRTEGSQAAIAAIRLGALEILYLPSAAANHFI